MQPAKLPPQNLEAEKSVLGSIFLDPNRADEISDIVSPDDFYLASHAAILRIISSLRQKGRPVDSVAVADELERSGELSNAGGVDALVEMMNCVPHSAHAAHYAAIVAEKSMRRRVISSSTVAIESAYDDSADVDELVAAAESNLHAVIERKVGPSITVIRDILTEALDNITTHRQLGVMTGLDDLDSLLGGLRPATMNILAARPSMGKTALAGSIALGAARLGIGVLFVSLEQSRLELTERFLCNETGYSSDQIRPEQISEAIRDGLLEGASQLSELPIVIDDTSPRTVQQVSAVARIQRRRNKVGLIVVDYLQLVRPDDKKAPREQQVAEISRELKCLAKNLNVPVLALAQLNRQIENRPDKRPRLSDLRESGAIEADADVIMFLDRPCVYDDSAERNLARLYIEKHRNGKTGIVDLHCELSCMRFANAARQHETAWEDFSTPNYEPASGFF